jgi:hypothetical protein
MYFISLTSLDVVSFSRSIHYRYGIHWFSFTYSNRSVCCCFDELGKGEGTWLDNWYFEIALCLPVGSVSKFSKDY